MKIPSDQIRVPYQRRKFQARVDLHSDANPITVEEGTEEVDGRARDGCEVRAPSVLRGWEKAGGGFGGAGEGEDDGACECDVLRSRRQALGSRARLGRVRPQPDPIFFSLNF